MRLLIAFVFCYSSMLANSVSHIIELEPSTVDFTLTQEDLNHFKITLFNASGTDSLLIPRYNNCLHFKGKLAGYNGKFIFYDKKIPYSQVKVEHPKFPTTYFELNKTDAFKDSVDLFNKRHHILFHKTKLELFMDCPQEPTYDFMFWSDKKPMGGFYYENLICVLMKDSLSTDSLKGIGNEYNLQFQSKSYTGLQVIYKLRKGKLKGGKNPIFPLLVSDSLRVKDAGVLIDSTYYAFFSSFYKIHALTINQIEKWQFDPISGLKSMLPSITYIKANDLEMGCGLYKHPYGLGLNILKYQNQIIKQEFKDKCNEQSQLLQNDKEYLILHTKTYSISGGEDIRKKKRKNEKKMAEIHADDKILKKEFNAPFGYIEPIVLSAD